MQNKLLLIQKDDFFDSKYYEKVIDDIFKRNKFVFGSSIPQGVITNQFGDKSEAESDFLQFEPEIESLYFDLIRGDIRSLVISFYNLSGRINYGLLAFSPSRQKFELIFVHWDINKIDTRENDSKLLNQDISSKIIKHIVDNNLDNVSSLISNPCVSLSEGLYYVDEIKCSPEIKEILKIVISEAKDDIPSEDIDIKTIVIDVENLDQPIFVKVEFEYEDKKFEYWVDNYEVIEISSFNHGDSQPNYCDVFFEIASKDYLETYGFIIKDNLLKKNKENTLTVLSNLYKKFTLKKYDNNLYGFQELGEPSFIELKDDCVELRVSRNTDIDDVTSFAYSDLANKTSLRKAIDKYILTKTKNYESFITEAHDFLNNSFDLDTTKRKGDSLLEKATSLPSFDKETRDFETLIKEIKVKHDKLLNIDKEKVSVVLGLIKKIKDIPSYDAYSDELYDAIDGLDEGELAAIKHEYDGFIEQFGSISEYFIEKPVFRRVFIRKNALEDLKRINDEQRDLRILDTVDEVVEQLKQLPGNQLGKYLLYKGLNFPIKADRSIKKIRILRNAKYRLLFVYGSDIEGNDRLNNLDSIYIFAVTEHKKDKADLYNAAKSKPTKYEINDFVIYPRNKILRIPECTSDQYKIATTYDNKPIITFGCAGSGKTTVSIEQYVNIVYSKFDCISPSSDELVYITFHKGLSDKVKKDLAEFMIEGNCYKIDEYFAFVVDEKYDPTKIVNEVKFIEWFDKTYSPNEIKKNKGKKKNKISPLLNKPDIARLLYTYYRGVFKGSKELLNTKENSLSQDVFLSEMKDETYLSDIEKIAIYQLCKEFDEFTKNNGLVSDNDLALKVIRQNDYQIKRTNCIIIDEVQDLTEIEIIATIMTLYKDSKRIYFYGDPHQSINPNVFDSNTINRVYTSLKKPTSSENSPLTITYRTNKHLINYLNELLKNRDKWIGLTKGGLSYITPPNKTEEDTSWAGYVTNKDLYKKIFESNPNSMIITPSESVRRKLLDKYPEIEPARAITIYDAKGMEWDTIIMYNMFTDYQSYFVDMISENGKAKKSTIHRMTFNKFYVGCTRSTKSFVIIEEDSKLFESENLIFKTLLSSFAPIYKLEQINTYILEDNTFEAWYKEALQNLDNENTSTFEHALMHAKRLAKTDSDRKLIQALIEGNPETLEQYGFHYLQEHEYDLAKSAFIKCNKTTKKHSAYVLLCAVLSGRNISEDHLREFLKYQNVIQEYPEVLPALMKQPAFKNRLRKIMNRLFAVEENKNA